VRSVRLWNLLNPKRASAKIIHTEHGTGWVCPYVEGRQALDEEMSHALIDIFNVSGRIVIDATAHRNFITTPDNEVVCVDIGMALQMETREEQHFARRRSIPSLKAWQELHDDYTSFFNKSSATFPETVNTIKALLFIKANRPDVFDVNFLRSNPDHKQLLASAYDQHNKIEDALKVVDSNRDPSIEGIKESCIKQLDHYINSRGSFKVEGTFSPTLTTKLFRDAKLTANKVNQARELRDLISAAYNRDEIKNLFQNLEPDTILKGRITQGFKACIGKCNLILDQYHTNLTSTSTLRG
jgi:hypothetical protein